MLPKLKRFSIVTLTIGGTGLALIALWTLALDNVDWSKPFAAGLLGASLGAIAGGLGTGIITVLVTTRIERRSRRQRRTEDALDHILSALEGDHWTLVNAYEDAVSRWRAAVDEATAGDPYKHVDFARGHLREIAGRLMEGIRLLRLHASRIPDSEFDKAFGQYLANAFLIEVGARAEGYPLQADLLRKPVLALLRRGNEMLGHRWWDPEDLTKYLDPRKDGESSRES